MSERALSKLRPNPKNPRSDIHGEGFDELVASVRAQGVLQPLLITDDGMILAGHRRYEAARMVGLDTVPVHVAGEEAKSGDRDLVCLIENLQRQDLPLLEVADYMLFCVTEYGFDAKGISNATGIRVETVKNYLKLANAPAQVKDAVRADRLGISGALELLRCKDPKTVTQILFQPDLSRSTVREYRKQAEANANTPSNLREMIGRLEDMDAVLDRFPDYRPAQVAIRQAMRQLIEIKPSGKRVEFKDNAASLSSVASFAQRQPAKARNSPSTQSDCTKTIY